LIYPPSRLHDYGSYMSSLGVQHTRQLIITRPTILTYSSMALQGKVSDLVSFPQEHLGGLIERHPRLVTASTETVIGILMLIEEVTGLAMASSAGVAFVMRGNKRLFSNPLATHEESLAYLSGFGVTQSGRRKL